MKLTPTTLPGVFIIAPEVFHDERGWFMESFNEQRFNDALQANGQPRPPRFVQDNHSVSHKGVVRGLHFQHAPHAQGKLVRVSQGATYNVVVDIRPGAPTFGQWFGTELSATNHQMLWIPAGFAHGFMALEDNTHLHYKTTAFYHRESEGSIRWNDPALGITWPDPAPVTLSEKDRHAPLLADTCPG